MYVTSHLKTHIFFQQNQVYLSYFLQLSVVTFTNFFDKRNIYQDFCNHTGLFKYSTVRYVTFGMDGFN